MARTTQGLVGKIIRVKEGVDLKPYIDIASGFIDEVLGGTSLSAVTLERIERYVSAHLYDLDYPRRSSETAGPVQESKEVIKVDLHLRVTKFGQTAIMLDTTGTLAAYINALDEIVQVPEGFAKTSRTRWLGTPIADY